MCTLGVRQWSYNHEKRGRETISRIARPHCVSRVHTAPPPARATRLTRGAPRAPASPERAEYKKRAATVNSWERVPRAS
eukprot:2245442-Prymnesium_polylepis.1